MTCQALFFGMIIALVSCSWGMTTNGGAKVGHGDGHWRMIGLLGCC